MIRAKERYSTSSNLNLQTVSKRLGFICIFITFNNKIVLKTKNVNSFSSILNCSVILGRNKEKCMDSKISQLYLHDVTSAALPHNHALSLTSLAQCVSSCFLALLSSGKGYSFSIYNLK